MKILFLKYTENAKRKVKIELVSVKMKLIN